MTSPKDPDHTPRTPADTSAGIQIPAATVALTTTSVPAPISPPAPQPSGNKE